MLKYLIQVTQDMTACGLMLAVVLAFLQREGIMRGRKYMLVGMLMGTIASIIMAIMERTTALVDTPIWNFWILVVAIVSTLIFVVLFFVCEKAKVPDAVKRIRDISAMLLACNYIFHSLTEVLLYPTQFVLADQSIFSTEFIFKFAGYLLALLLVFLASLAIYHVLMGLSEKAAVWLVVIALVVQCLGLGVQLLSIAMARRLVVLSHELFVIVKEFVNAGDYFIFAILLATLVLPILLLIKSRDPKEEYSNPAEKRKIDKKWRTRRRWSVALIVFYVCTVMTLTVVQGYANKEVELSPSEPIDLRGDEIYVPLSDVEDGHLHRFTYETKDGVGVRFIVIKKPNSSAYGVGLDACEICGETGYYERDDQVVCKLCDVVMNINTIGFKGGCNPIPIEYKVQGGHIIVPISTLEEKQDDFK